MNSELLPILAFAMLFSGLLLWALMRGWRNAPVRKPMAVRVPVQAARRSPRRPGESRR